jgi:iron complex outermembrane recepter protein
MFRISALGGVSAVALQLAFLSVSDVASAQSSEKPLPSVTIDAPGPARPTVSRPTSENVRSARSRRARAKPAVAPQIPVSTNQVPVTQTTAGVVQGIRALSAVSATRTDTPIEQIPQSIQVVPRQLINEQAATSVSEAALNVSNVQPVNSLIVGNADQLPIKIRGFGAEQWRDGLVNLYNVGDRDGLVNVERIEVLKGPNAILYGGGAGAPVGGVVNVISKLPTDKAGGEFGIRLGSFQYWNPFFDINQPLNVDKTALFRITGEYTGNKSFIDVIESKRYNINPTLTLTNKEDTTLTIQGNVSRQQQQAYQGLPVYGTLLGDFRARTDLFIGPSNIEPSYSKTEGVTATFDHQFNSIFSANVKARWSRAEFDQLSQNVFGADFTGAVPAFPPSTWFVQNIEMFQQQREFTINPSLQAKFALGPTVNTLLVGADYSHVNDRGFMSADYLGNACFLFLGICPPVTVDLSNPSFPVPYTRPNPSAGFEFLKFFDFQNSYINKGAYTQLQTSLYDRVHFLGGVRLASIDITYNENALAVPSTFITETTRALPRAGVVVDLVKGLSVYASYSEGMRWAGFTTAVSRPLPELSNQIEGGLKFNLNNQLAGSLAVFEIHKSNVPALLSLGVAGLTTQRSKGFEADLTWQPNRNWSFLGSYGFTDAVFAEPFLDFTGATIPGGTKLPFVPAHTGRLWANYKFNPGWLEGWSIGAGLYTASGQYVDNANLWQTNGYFTVDAKIGYERDHLRAFITAKNLTGERYFTPYTWLGGQVAPGAPRTIYGQISYLY